MKRRQYLDLKLSVSPLLLSIFSFLALKNAVSMASETSNADLLNAPATPSKILAAVYNDHSM